MSDPTDRAQRCTVCQWTQPTGRGETVIDCPGCGATSWERVPIEEAERYAEQATEDAADLELSESEHTIESEADLDALIEEVRDR